ncbi:MAG: DAK2 domain-containing protein [Halanaerobiales bacterium]
MPANRENNKEIIKYIKGNKLQDLFISALQELKNQRSLIDSLNVFPVPDGDTGTNMYLTLKEAVKEMKKVSAYSVGQVTAALAEGALMGARGNSGVILSQLLRGFSLINKENRQLSARDLVESLQKASEVAYQGVLKPVEGTILTVSRKAAEGGRLALENNLDIKGIMESALGEARNALNNTPELLPELKEAEVVDAGGQGYVTILEGMYAALTGRKTIKSVPAEETEIKVVEPVTKEKQETGDSAEELTHTYCTQVLIKDGDSNEHNIDEIRSDLRNYGDSLMVVGSDRVIKIHIHTNHPGVILEYALKIGDLSNVKIDNMSLQTEERREKREQDHREEFGKEDRVGIISVVQGEGFKNIFSNLGADKIIDGGQSMNPSTNDFVKAIEEVHSSEIIIFPNNKNIISAAQQAASLSDRRVEVVPTRNIPQAVSSLIVMDREQDIEKSAGAARSELETVTTLEITRAVKKSSINGHDINEGDVIGVVDGEILAAGDKYRTVILEVLAEIITDQELLTLYYGENISESGAKEIAREIANEFSRLEIEVYFGGQPLYPYIISIE